MRKAHAVVECVPVRRAQRSDIARPRFRAGFLRGSQHRRARTPPYLLERRIERFAEHLAARAGMAFEEYLRLGVLEPLALNDTKLRGSPAYDVRSTVSDLLAFSRELLHPALVSDETLMEAIRPQFPDLAGVLPDVGRFDPNPWGLTFEIRDDKRPHWTGNRNSPATFGHFGGSGAFLWVDPEVELATVALTDRDFGPWALEGLACVLGRGVGRLRPVRMTSSHDDRKRRSLKPELSGRVSQRSLERSTDTV